MVCIATFSREFYYGVYNIAGAKPIGVLSAARGLLSPVHILPDRDKVGWLWCRQQWCRWLSWPVLRYMYYARKIILITSLTLLLSVEISICIFYLWLTSFMLRRYEYINECLLHSRLTWRKVFILWVSQQDTWHRKDVTRGSTETFQERSNPTEQSPKGIIKIRLTLT